MPSLFGVLRFSSPPLWPPKQSSVIQRVKNDDFVAQLSVDETGRLNFVAYDSSGKQTAFLISQPITMDGIGSVQFNVVWDVGQCHLRLQRKDVLPDSPDAPALAISLTSAPRASALEAADAVAACQEWIDKRKTKFQLPPQARPDHRIKTIDEEANELRDASLSLSHLSKEILKENAHFIGDVASRLRALLYFKRDDAPEKTYNPLLLRMASKADLPLPTYYPPAPTTVQATPGALLHVTMHVPQIHRLFRTDKIIDLQEWLKTGVVEMSGVSMAAKEFIFRVSVTKGSAHHDPQVSKFVGSVENMRGPERDELLSFMCKIVDVVIPLSSWVLSELSRLKLIV